MHFNFFDKTRHFSRVGVGIFAIFMTLFASPALAKPLVITSILPYKYFIDSIAGDTVQSVSLTDERSDPHTYSPSTTAMKQVEGAAIYFKTGVEFEDAWLSRVSAGAKNLKIIDATAGIAKLADTHNHAAHSAPHSRDSHTADKHGSHSAAASHGKHDHDAGKHGHSAAAAHDKHDHDDDHDAHDHGDPHIWLDPVHARQIAANIAAALSEAFPQNRAIYEANLADFQIRAGRLHEEIDALFKGVKSRTFLIYHPAYSYFAKRYNLTQLAIENEGKEPSAKELAATIKRAKELNISTIFTTDGTALRPARTIAKELRGRTQNLSNLIYEWEAGLKQSAAAIAQSLK